MDRRVAVAAVAGRGDVTRRLRARDGRRRGAEAIAVVIAVPRRRAHRGWRIGRIVAVVVDLVADLDRARIDRRAAVVAIAARCDVAGRRRARVCRRARTESVAVAVLIPVGRVGRVVIDREVAVVVGAVAHFCRARMDGAARVVAVRRVRDVASRLRTCALARRRVAAAVAVGIAIPGRRVTRGARIRRAIAVVVDLVADLGCARVDGASPSLQSPLVAT